jgi:hypothetical protein
VWQATRQRASRACRENALGPSAFARWGGGLDAGPYDVAAVGFMARVPSRQTIIGTSRGAARASRETPATRRCPCHCSRHQAGRQAGDRDFRRVECAGLGRHVRRGEQAEVEGEAPPDRRSDKLHPLADVLLHAAAG